MILHCRHLSAEVVGAAQEFLGRNHNMNLHLNLKEGEEAAGEGAEAQVFLRLSRRLSNLLHLMLNAEHSWQH